MPLKGAGECDDSPLNEAGAIILQTTQPRILGLAARGERRLESVGWIDPRLTPIVQPNIYFSYVNVLKHLSF